MRQFSVSEGSVFISGMPHSNGMSIHVSIFEALYEKRPFNAAFVESTFLSSALVLSVAVEPQNDAQ